MAYDSGFDVEAVMKTLGTLSDKYQEEADEWLASGKAMEVSPGACAGGTDPPARTATPQVGLGELDGVARLWQ